MENLRGIELSERNAQTLTDILQLMRKTESKDEFAKAVKNIISLLEESIEFGPKLATPQLTSVYKSIQERAFRECLLYGELWSLQKKSIKMGLDLSSEFSYIRSNLYWHIFVHGRNMQKIFFTRIFNNLEG